MRSWLPTSWATRSWLLVTALEATVNITMEAIILSKGDYWHNLFSSAKAGVREQVLPVYLAIFAVAHAFQFVLAVDAIYNRNTIQIIGLCLFNAALLVYAIMQIEEARDAFQAIDAAGSIEVYVTVVPVVIGIAQVCYCILAWSLFKEFGWEIFKSLGADRRIKKMYRSYQIFICMCKFDVFFLFAFSLQFCLLVLKQRDIERYLTIAAIPITLALLAVAFYAVRRENTWLMLVFGVGCILGAAYFAFKLFRIFQNQNGAYTRVQKSLTTFSVLAMSALVVTTIQAYLVFRNFGRGLKEHMGHRDRVMSGKAEEAGYTDDFIPGLHYRLESSNSIGSRMSID